jgi:hypothetical protein
VIWFARRSTWLLFGAAACVGNGSGPNASQGRLRLSVSAQRPTTAMSTASVVQTGDSTLIAMGEDTVIVRGVDVVLRRLELRPLDASACEGEHEDGSETGSTTMESSSQEPEHDDCEEVKAGPVLVSLPLGTTATETIVDGERDPPLRRVGLVPERDR